MTFERNQTIEPSGLFKMAPPFWGKPRMASFIVAALAEVQAVEDAIWTVLDGLDVDTCSRWVLEGLAAIVGEPTRPASTDELRIRVKARILINKSDGTPSAVAGLIAGLTTGTVRVHEHSEEIRVLQYADPPLDPDVAAEMLDAACAAGKSSCWITGAGTGSWALPDYGDPSPDLTRRTGVGKWSDRHG